MDNLEKAYGILKEAGWYEGRQIDISEMVELLENRGFVVYPKVKEFLAEFGMLDIKAPTPLSDEVVKMHNFNKYHFHTTNVFKALGDAGTYVGAAQYEKFAAEKLVTVGDLYKGNLGLFVSEGGKVYCDEGKLGDNAWEAWERLFSRKSCIQWGDF